MVCAIGSFIEFCYFVRRSVLDDDDVEEVNHTIARFHQERVIFEHEGVQPDGFSLPRQHSLVHYPFLITEFGAPNGLCVTLPRAFMARLEQGVWCI
jgi:hypothetical protein